MEQLMKKHSIEAICSINESLELTAKTIVGHTITPDDWRHQQIDQLVIEAPDFTPPTFEQLEEGARFIDRYLTDSRRVYCHCKSGKGRSASLVMAYFIRYKRMDIHAAYRMLKSKRPVIFEESSPQMRNLIKYQEYLLKK